MYVAPWCKINVSFIFFLSPLVSGASREATALPLLHQAVPGDNQTTMLAMVEPEDKETTSTTIMVQWVGLGLSLSLSLSLIGSLSHVLSFFCTSAHTLLHLQQSSTHPQHYRQSHDYRYAPYWTIAGDPEAGDGGWCNYYKNHNNNIISSALFVFGPAQLLYHLYHNYYTSLDTFFVLCVVHQVSFFLPLSLCLWVIIACTVIMPLQKHYIPLQCNYYTCSSLPQEWLNLLCTINLAIGEAL